MGAVDTFALGRSIRSTFVTETTFDDAAQTTPSLKPVAGSSARILSYSLDATEERVTRNDKRNTRSALERIQRRKAVSGSIESFFNPRGTTTPPDVGALLESAFGTETVGGSDVTYSLSDGQSLPTLRADFESESVYMETATGLWVNELTISVPGTDEPRLSFSIGAGTHVLTGTGTANGAGASSTSLVLQAGEARGFEKGSLISIGAVDNVLVIDVNYGTDTLTLDAAQTWSDTDVVQPYTPYSEDTTDIGGSPIAVISGQVDIGADTNLIVQAAEITLNNNIKEINAVVGRDKTVDIIPGHREVSGSVTLFGRQADFVRLGRAKAFDVTNVNPPAPPGLVLTLGVTGAQCVVNVPRPFFDFGSIEFPEAEEATVTLPFMALATTSSGVSNFDELSLVWS